MLPSGLVTCFINDNELKIVDISKESLSVRSINDISKIDNMTICFYDFKSDDYDEISVKDFKLKLKSSDEFYKIYTCYIYDERYSMHTDNIMKRYSNYVTLKTYGDENEFSNHMVKYPSERDYEFYDLLSDAKREWMKDIEYDTFDEDCLSSVSFAVSLNNEDMYKDYLNLGIDEFYDGYLDANHIESHKLFKYRVSRIYIGSEVCHNLFPDINILMSMMDKAVREGLEITLCFTYIRDYLVEQTEDIIESIYKWCVKNNKNIEVTVNDYAMIEILKDKGDMISPILGILLNKRKKDPRMMYKKGVLENKDELSKNSLNVKQFRDFLVDNNIKRYEYESCGYRIDVPEGTHSIHLPFYVTNTSQYCPLYAKCTTMDRGNQRLVKNCPKYCKDYFFSYPKHLKMAGIYNSLFSFDDTLLKDFCSLKYYIDNNIDRIVFNFM